MLEACPEGLALRAEGVYVGRQRLVVAVHAARVLAGLGPRGRLVALDRDPEAVAVGAALD
jgi:16S rRNA (cytosine1402-N4)-methyltransferase